MARPKKALTEQNRILAEELRNTFNTDSWHRLFDILVEYEQDGGSADDKVGQLIQKFIEQEFGKHTFPWKTETEYILTKLSGTVGAWIFRGRPIPAMDKDSKKSAIVVRGLLTKQDHQDIVQSAFLKLMVSGTYNHTADEAERASYLYKLAYSATMDILRPMKKFNYLLVPDAEIPPKKKIA